MGRAPDRTALIAGAGIAGLTAALAFAQRGWRVELLERETTLKEAGAGLQLSPNATRILDRLGVLDTLSKTAVEPSAVVLRRACGLREIAVVPLGQAARRRWGAPYLCAHRADLQQALLAKVAQEPAIRLSLSSPVISPTISDGQVALAEDRRGVLLVGADGVWSGVRAQVDPAAARRFCGQAAFRRTVDADSPEGRFLTEQGGGAVTAFLHPAFHVVAYPVRFGRSINLAAFMRCAEPSPDGHAALIDRFRAALAGTALRTLAGETSGWSVWPLHAISSGRWTLPQGVALIGDAAHAMPPFAAQGAALAIEDAEELAVHADARPHDLAGALAAWERARRPRIRRVERRGRLNGLAWHAAGPVAIARDLLLTLRSQESLAADLDWLYGYDAADGSQAGGPEPR